MDQRTYQCAEEILSHAQKVNTELSRGMFKVDFAVVVQLLAQAKTAVLMQDILAELRLQNHKLRMELNPFSMMNNLEQEMPESEDSGKE